MSWRALSSRSAMRALPFGLGTLVLGADRRGHHRPVIVVVTRREGSAGSLAGFGGTPCTPGKLRTRSGASGSRAPVRGRPVRHHSWWSGSVLPGRA